MLIINYIDKSFNLIKPFASVGFYAYSCNRTKLAVNCLLMRLNNNKKKKYDYTFY